MRDAGCYAAARACGHARWGHGIAAKKTAGARGPTRSMPEVCPSAPRSFLGARLGGDWGVGRLQEIMAPFAGWCAALDEVPDEVFAGRMLGDGLAIDPPDGVVLAPCDGEILNLPASGHAVSIRTPHGFEVLITIGIDTVRLGGRGFNARVKTGARVRIGDELIRFDLDLVARAAKSLMTPIVVTSDGAVLKHRRASGAIRAGEVLFLIDGAAARQGSSLSSQAGPPSAPRAQTAIPLAPARGKS